MQLSRAPLRAVKLLGRLLPFLAVLAPSASAGRHGARISPKLDPESDKVFFKKDYPDDLDPKGQGKLKFNHPYPAVQDHHEYDKDYVKDENADGGEWKAQMEYDQLRTKISKETDDYQKAKETEEQLRHDVEEAKAKEEAAAQAAKEAEKRVEEAKQAATKSKSEAEQASAEAKAAGESAAKQRETAAKDREAEVDEAVEKVKKEMDDLKDCQQKLADARAALKRLVQQRDGNATAGSQEAAEESSEVDRAAKAAAAAELEVTKAVAEEAKRRAEDAELKREIAEEEAKHDDARHVYEKESAEMGDMEHNLDAAAHRLRKYRKDSGEHTEHSKSSAFTRRICAPLLVVVAGALLSSSSH